MRVEVGSRTHEGRAIDLEEPVPPEAILRAVRGETGAETDVAVDCPSPGPVHDHVGYVHPDLSLQLQGALAAAARSRGCESSRRAELEEVRADLNALAPEAVDVTAARRRAAEAGAEERRLRERVATLRGRVQTLRELGEVADVSAAEADLEAAIERLSEAETERIAANQCLDRLERQASEARDGRERRLELQDRLGNLERSARSELAGAVHDRFASAVDAVPGEGTPGDRPEEYAGDPVTAALAVVRVAALDAPVVLPAGRFEGAAAAADCLDEPVIQIP